MSSNRSPAPRPGSRAGRPLPPPGFLMIEVLVSLIIISIGLLGLAGLHAVAVAKGGSSMLRYKATELGYAMADRMRSNLVAVNAGAFANLAPGQGLVAPGCLPTCSPAQLAVLDYLDWSAEVAAALPQGVGVVCLDSTPDDGTPTAPACDGLGSVLVVKVLWTEKSEHGSTTPRSFVFSTPVRPS